MLQPPIPDADAGLAPDVLHAIALINTAYSPSSSLDEVQAAQAALLAVQRTRGAWGLVVPLLSYSSASSGGEVNVQFFGAHTAHAKIARGDLGELSAGEQVGLRDALVGMAGVPGRARVARRKVYGAVVALAVRMVGGSSGSGGWDGWIEGTVQALVQAGAPSGHVHEFLAGAAEDIGAANLLPQHRIQLTESLRTAAPLVLQSIAAVLSNNDASALPSALACLAAWLPSGVLPAPDVARLVPPLIALLDSQDSSISASTALSELLARPPAAWAARPAVLLEPLFVWVYRAFPLPDADYTYASIPPPALRRHARLLVALAEAGVEWVAGCVVDESGVHAGASAAGVAYATEMQVPVTRGALARHFLRVMLALTAADRGGARLAEGAGEDADEDGEEEDQEAGAALGFWYLLQEALWEVPVANAYLYDAVHASPSTSTSTSSSTQTQTRPGFPSSTSGSGFPFSSSSPFSGFPASSSAGFPTSSSSTSVGAGFPPTPSTDTPMPTSTPATPSNAEEPNYAEMTDAEMGRGRGGAGGTPWTPGAGAASSAGGMGGGMSVSPSPAGVGSGAQLGQLGLGQRVEGEAGGQDDDEDGDEDEEGGGRTRESPAHQARAAHARAAYAALVRILRGKVVCGRGRGWGRDRLERFAVYRRDVADTLVNAYYILRDDLLAFYVADVAARLDARAGWEDIEATLHCLRAVHEALDPDAAGANPALARLFGAGVFGRLPVGYGAEEYRGRMGVPGGGHGGGMGLGLGEEREREEREAIARVRRTALGLVDTYSAYFTTQPPEALGAPLRYVLGALADPEPGVCLQGALALRSLCDANRRALAGQIGAFAEVHAGIGGVPDSEKGKVLQSIASVIQALPPAEGVGPVEALVRPVLQRLAEALGAAGAHPEPARLAAILQLEILAGIARGLTRTADPLAFDEDDGGGEEGEAVRVAREDPRSGGLRNGLFEAIAQVAELWSADSEVGQALSELFRAITALPADVTLLSLPAQPLLSVVCRAAGRRLTAVWLALATILIAQLNPPPMILTLQSAPSPEAEAGVRGAVGEIVGAALTVLGAPGGMVENPDIVQEFFACMDRVAQDFTGAFCALPDGAFDALIQCAISALALQERYSLVAACTFLGTLIHRTALYAAISPELLQQLQAHMIRVHGRAIMRAVLCGFAGAAPRSVTSNLLELLGALVGRWDERAVSEAEGGAAGGYAPQGGRGTHVGGGARGWVPGVVFADDFFPSKAGQDAKERFVKTVVSSRSVKKTKEAANQFAIVAWGLEGSTFGYSSA